MCPSHLAATPWADSSTELNDPPGLTDFGRDVITTCNEIGVLVDLAHCSDYTCRDTLAVANAPVIATHTKVRAITGSLRDMSDDVLRGVADTGGVACVLAATPRTPQERHAARLKRDRDLANTYKDPFDLGGEACRRANLEHEARSRNNRPRRYRCGGRPRWAFVSRTERSAMEGVYRGAP